MLSLATHVTLTDPDDPMGMPAFDGPARDAADMLDPGTYAVTVGHVGEPDAAPGTLVIADDATRTTTLRLGEDVRPRVVAMLGEERNGWMHPYGLASTRLARAVVDGKVDRGTLLTFPRYRPSSQQVDGGPVTSGHYVPDTLEESTRALERMLALDEDDYAAGSENLALAVDWLRDLAGGPITLSTDDPAVWSSLQVEPHALHQHGLTRQDVDDFLATLDVVDAAALTLEADAHYSATGYTREVASPDPDCADCAARLVALAPDVQPEEVPIGQEEAGRDAAALDVLADAFRRQSDDLIADVEAALRATGRLQ